MCVFVEMISFLIRIIFKEPLLITFRVKMNILADLRVNQKFVPGSIS